MNLRRTPRRLAVGSLLGAVLLAATSAAPALGALDWAKMKVPTTKRLLDVAFASGTTGVAVGQGGTIIATLDGGATWGDRLSPVAGDLRAVTSSPCPGGAPCFWAGAADGSIIFSGDGGNTWCTQTTGTAEKVSGIVAASADEVIAVGTNGMVVRSTTPRACGTAAGYTAVTSAGTRNLFGVTRAPDGSTVVVGAQGLILRQVGTDPFAVVTSGTDVALDEVTTARGTGTSYTLYAVGESGMILASTDGLNWARRASGTRWDLHDVSFPVNQQVGVAVGDTGTILVTADGGRTWNPQTSANCNHLFGVSMVDDGRGWTAGGSGTVLVIPGSAKGTPARCASTGLGYWMVASDGGIFSFGDAGFFGSTGDIKLNRPIVDMAATGSGEGYWLTASDGGIFTFGDAAFHGSTGAISLNQPIVGMATTPSGEGYWLAASDGGIFTFGDAGFFGSTGDVRLNSPIVGMAPTATGQGYWLVARDGGVFAFGDAKFLGSAGGMAVASPFVAMAATPSGLGYWLATADGAVFTFGDAASLGAANGSPLAKPVVGMAVTPTGAGYWLVASDGGIFSYGDAGFYGSTGNIVLNQPIVGMSNS